MTAENRTHRLAITFLFRATSNGLLSKDQVIDNLESMKSFDAAFWQMFLFFQSKFSLPGESVEHRKSPGFPHPIILITSALFHLSEGKDKTIDEAREKLAQTIEETPLSPYLLFQIDNEPFKES